MGIDFDRPREDLVRMVPTQNASMRADDGNNGLGVLVGYPIVFNEWTEINGWEGNFLERIDPRATDDTLSKRGDQVKVLFNHGFDPSIGDKPLGKPRTMEIQDKGVWTETPLADTSYNRDLKELLDVGAIDGMSFRFTVLRDEWEDNPKPSDINPRGLPQRTVKHLRLYEYGPVTFPAYEATTAGVRARDAYLAYRQAKQGGKDTYGNGVPVENPIETDLVTDILQDARLDEAATKEALDHLDTDPTLTIIEDFPIGDEDTIAPDPAPPVSEPTDTPETVHLSENETEPLMTPARYQRIAGFRRDYMAAVEQRSLLYGDE